MSITISRVIDVISFSFINFIDFIAFVNNFFYLTNLIATIYFCLKILVFSDSRKYGVSGIK